METTDKEISNLRPILENLVGDLSLTGHELSMIMVHIFEGAPQPEFILDDRELVEQVCFLRQLIDDRKYTTVEDLQSHFDDLKIWAEGLYTPSIDMACGSGGFLITNSDEDHISFQELFEFLQEEFTDKLTPVKQTFFWDDVYTRAIEKLNDNFKYYQRENVSIEDLIFLKNDLSRYANDADTITTFTGPIFEVYLKRFASNSHQETFIQYTKKPDVLKRFLIASLFPSEFRGGTDNIENMLELSYNKIMDIVTLEHDIKSNILKKSLGIWIAYSKFRCLSFDPTFSYADFVDGLSKDDLKHEFCERSHLQFSSWSKPLLETLLEKKWRILKSPARHPWITTDNPGLSVSASELEELANLIPDTLWHSIRKDSLEYYPLSCSYCLRLEPLDIDHHFPENKDVSIGFTLTSEKEVSVVNALTRKAKPRALISSSKRALRKEVTVKKRAKYSKDHKMKKGGKNK